MFCSEVVYHAFMAEGMDLWSIRSDMSDQGLVRWLAGMGVKSSVRSFRPISSTSRRCAWSYPSALMDYRFDNATTNALLLEADLGDPWHMLGVARLLKSFSVG